MASNDTMDIETQRRVEYTRQKLMRIDQMNEQLRKLNKSNKHSEEKLDRLVKRKESLELDVARLEDASMRTEPEIGTDLLHSIEEPMDIDVIYGEAFREKMCHLKVLLNEIIARTSFNEKAMCKEIGHQEAEFENRLKEAINLRNSINRKSEESQKKCELLIREHANVYEDVREMEENIEKFDASRWLLNVEKRRVSDILDRTRREPKTGINCRKPYIVSREASTVEDLVSSSASLTHNHLSPEHHFEERYDYVEPNHTVKNIQKIEKNQKVHKEWCPKSKKTPLVPIPHSNSLISSKTDVTDNKKKSNCVYGDGLQKLPINGINLMDLISKALEDELATL